MPHETQDTKSKPKPKTSNFYGFAFLFLSTLLLGAGIGRLSNQNETSVQPKTDVQTVQPVEIKPAETVAPVVLPAAISIQGNNNNVHIGDNVTQITKVVERIVETKETKTEPKIERDSRPFTRQVLTQVKSVVSDECQEHYKQHIETVAKWQQLFDK